MRTTEGKVFRALGIAGGVAGFFYLMLVLSFLGASLGPIPANSGAPADHRLKVVTSVQVWADLAQELGGKYVKAAAIIANPGQDPHSYEATVRDQLAVNRADLTITNGGDYDPFFAKLVSKKPNATAASNPVLSNVKLATKNPHLWYDLKAAQAIVAEIGKRLAAATPTADPVVKAAIRSNTASYQQRLAALVQQQAATRLATEGKAVILTEGFAAPMLQHLAITDRTPRAFLNAVEEEQDASPKVMNQLKQMLQTHRVQALILNQQTEGYQTNQLVGWAKQSGVPVLRLGELLPKNQTYLQWMESNLNQIEKAFK